MAKKKEKEIIINNQKKEFSNSKEQFLKSLKDFEEEIKSIVHIIKNSQSLQNGVQELIKMEGKIAQINILKDIFQKKGNLLLKEDESSIIEIQSEVTSTLHYWDTLIDHLKQETDIYCNLQQNLVAFNIIKSETDNLLQDFEKNISEIVKAPNDLTEAYIIREKYKILFDKIESNKNYFEKLENTEKKLLNLTKPIPNFEIEELEKDAKENYAKLNYILETVKDRISTLDTEIILWQQIDELKNQLLPWLQEMNEELPSLLNNLIDISATSTKLKFFEEQLNIYQDYKSNIITKQEQLIQLSNGQTISNINSLMILLDDQFKELIKTYNALSDIVNICKSKEDKLKNDLKIVASDINVIRENVTKCDDVGSTLSPYERLGICRDIKQQLCKTESKIKNIEQLGAEIIKVNPNYINSSVIKESDSVQKRYTDISSYLLKIEEKLISSINKNYKDKLFILKDSINEYNNKLTLCFPKESCDIDHLMTILSNLLNIEKDFIDVKNEAQKIENMKSLLIQHHMEDSINEMNSLKETVFLNIDLIENKINDMKSILSKQIELITNYENYYNKILFDLNKIEEKINLRSIDLIDNAKIESNIEKIEQMQSDCSQLTLEKNNLCKIANELFEFELKTKLSNVNVLEEKLTNIITYFQNRSNKLNNVKDCYIRYNEKINKMDSFLTDANMSLEKFINVSENENLSSEILRSKLEEFKNFSKTKDLGIVLLNEITELSEILYLELIPERRDIIRMKMKSIRNSMENLSDKSVTSLKKIESLLQQKANIDDNRKQILGWISSVENEIKPGLELKTTLQEKKKLLNKYLTLLQDVQFQKPIIEQLLQKIESVSLESDNNEFISRYHNLNDTISNYTNILEKQVAHHELYINHFEKLQDFLDILQSEENKCNDNDIGNQISIYENIIDQENVGNKFIQACEESLSTVLQETDDVGKKNLIFELNGQKENFAKFLDKCQAMLKKLISKKNQTEKLEKIILSLDEFLKTVEIELKDQSLKNTADAKKLFLENIKKIYNDIDLKNKDFNLLKEEASGTNPELTETCLKLISRYNSVKVKIKVY